MSAWWRCPRVALLAAVLSLGGLLPIGPGAVTSAPARTATSATEERVQQAGNYPHHVLILRHAEKPNADDDPHLTSRGAARAAALPALFSIAPTFPTKPASFPTPDFIFATKESHKSNRPVETVEPL